jgi:hypothetical protein
VMVVVVMVPRGKRRAGKHHQEQGSGNNFLHGMNLARGPCPRVAARCPRIKTGTGVHSGRGNRRVA